MSTLTITRGLPGSGKTTWARMRVIAALGRTVRVSRDSIRSEMFAVDGKVRLSYEDEQAVTAAQHAAVRAFLASGRDVIVDDTNLRLKFARGFADLAAEMGAEFHVEDFTDVPLEVCIERDAARRHQAVGADVIQVMHEKFRPDRGLPPVTPTGKAQATDWYASVVPYEAPDPELGLPKAWLVDIDGTLALMKPGGRKPYDWARVYEDDTNMPVLEMVWALGQSGYKIVVMSGRDESCRRDTENWLFKNLVVEEALHMRAAGDNRSDYLVKYDLFNEHIRGRYDVRGVLDDRDQVVRLWRALGLTCAQVAPGDF